MWRSLTARAGWSAMPIPEAGCDGRSRRLLILGGTAEAAALAQDAVDRLGDRLEVITSLAGRTRSPRPLAGETRTGDFGGAELLDDLLAHVFFKGSQGLGIELGADDLDQDLAILGRQHLDQVGEVGVMERLHQFLDAMDIRRVQGIDNFLHQFRPDDVGFLAAGILRSRACVLFRCLLGHLAGSLRRGIGIPIDKARMCTRRALRIWCGREDSNFHGVSPTATSTLRVYQFRHDRKTPRRQPRACPHQTPRGIANHQLVIKGYNGAFARGGAGHGSGGMENQRPAGRL